MFIYGCCSVLVLKDDATRSCDISLSHLSVVDVIWQDLSAMVGQISEELAHLQRNLAEKQQEIAQATDSCKTRMESLQEQRQQLLRG